MNKEEIDIINYRPILDIKRKILSKVVVDESYSMPPLLESMSSMLPINHINKIGNILDAIDNLKNRLSSELANNVSDGIPFSKYKQEKESSTPDYELIDKFEKFNEDNIKGDTRCEVYPILDNLKKEFNDYRNYLNDKFYNGEVKYDDTADVLDKECSTISKLVDKDIANELSTDDIKGIETKVSIAKYIDNRINNTDYFVKDIDNLLNFDINTYYNGNIRDIVKELSDTPNEVLGNLNFLSSVHFNCAAEKSRQDKRRDSKLNNAEIKKGMNDIMFKVADAKSNIIPNILEWAKDVNTNFDQSPNTIIIEDALDSIEFVEEEFKSIVLEMYKTNETDRLVKKDQVDTMLGKKKIRLTTELKDNVIKSKQDTSFDINSVI